MHVRKEAQQSRIVRQGTGDFHAIIIGARWNDKTVICELEGEHPLLWLLFRKDHADASLVRRSVAVGRVMHLENEVRTRGYELCLAVGPAVRFAARCVNQQHVTRGRVGLRALLRIGKARRREGHTHGRIAQPLRGRRPDVNHRVVYVLAARWPNLRHLHPFVPVNPVGAISYVYSTSPVAGRPTGSGICTTLSGSGMFQPLAQWRGGGASFGEPAGARPTAASARSSRTASAQFRLRDGRSDSGLARSVRRLCKTWDECVSVAEQDFQQCGLRCWIVQRCRATEPSLQRPSPQPLPGYVQMEQPCASIASKPTDQAGPAARVVLRERRGGAVAAPGFEKKLSAAAPCHIQLRAPSASSRLARGKRNR